MQDVAVPTVRLRDGRRVSYEEMGDARGRPVLYFHGWPGSRIEARLADEAARDSGIRLLALDRPGMGLSDHRPGRRLTDWPDDVLDVADALGLDRFAVLGISGGGPYAVACAWKLPERLTAAGIVSSLAPLDVPGALDGMIPRDRFLFRVVGRVHGLRRLLVARSAKAVRRDPERVLASGVVAPVDKAYLDRPHVRAVLAQSLTEAYRTGSRGPEWELAINVRPWGFRLEEIRTSVHLWHGEADANAPIAMGRHLAASIPGCRATFLPGEGHLHFIDRLPEILAATGH